VVAPPEHTVSDVPVIGVAAVLTVNTIEVEHVPIVYAIVVLPAAAADTRPPAVIVAAVLLLLLHTPPATASLSCDN
jgi:hypothetical protein